MRAYRSLSFLYRCTAVIGALGLSAGMAARGQGITPIFLSAAASGSNTIFTYQLDLEKLTTADANTFITFYDFGGLTGTPTFTAASTGLGTNASFSTSIQNLGLTPADCPPLTPDNPSLSNVTFKYNGSADIMNTPGASGPIVLGNVSITSTLGLSPTALTAFAAQATNTQSQKMACNTSFVRGPDTPTGALNSVATPEPGLLGLFVSTGMASLTVLRARRRRR